jgi:dihydropteroate synthase
MKNIFKKSKTSKTPLIMGILNITPDSFSDGGNYYNINSALKRAKAIIKEGADIIDIGGESTGVGSKFISSKEELKRILPVIKGIRKFSKIPISVDTYKSQVAEKALLSGANIINDITSFRGDGKILNIIKKYNCPYIIMYSKDKTPRTTKKNKKYKNIIATITGFFKKRLQILEKKGIKKSNIILDPGMGQFISAIPQYSYEIISRLKELKDNFNLPILIGISRKSFLQGAVKKRDEKGNALSMIAYLNGASIIRTHDVKGLKEFLNNFH